MRVLINNRERLNIVASNIILVVHGMSRQPLFRTSALYLHRKVLKINRWLEHLVLGFAWELTQRNSLYATSLTRIGFLVDI